jgi:proline-specific peptidase
MMRGMKFSPVLAAIAFFPLFAVETRSASRSIYPIKEGYVDANGAFIYYAEFGWGSPLLIVHGGPGASHDYFLPWQVPLGRTHRLIFIDERGSGRSERLEDVHQYTVENMVEDVEAVRNALGLGKISLLGHSYGGVLAQAYALKYQENLSHLVLASTFPSTKQMNEVLAHEKEQLPPAKLARLEALEKAGLYGKGDIWEHGRYSEEYEKLAWGDGYFRFYTEHIQIRTMIQQPIMRIWIGSSIARCGVQMASF